MAVGSDGYQGLAVPLFGESEIVQQNSGNDILTITRSSGNTDDFLVMRDSGGQEYFVVYSNGRLALPNFATTAPTTGLTKGDVFLSFVSSTPQIGIVSSSAANTIEYITADTKTAGRTTA